MDRLSVSCVSRSRGVSRLPKTVNCTVPVKRHRYMYQRRALWERVPPARFPRENRTHHGRIWRDISRRCLRGSGKTPRTPRIDDDQAHKLHPRAAPRHAAAAHTAAGTIGSTGRCFELSEPGQLGAPSLRGRVASRAARAFLGECTPAPPCQRA